MPDLTSRLAFAPVTESDFDELVALRIAAMRESLERVGRFDPVRARERLRASFYPADTQFIVFDGVRVGFSTFRFLPTHAQRWLGGRWRACAPRCARARNLPRSFSFS
jgi:hypothetical protein